MSGWESSNEGLQGTRSKWLAERANVEFTEEKNSRGVAPSRTKQNKEKAYKLIN